jgi:hypothetical protein
MPNCRFCNYDVHPSIGQCPQCGAPVDRPSAELERQVRALLGQGQKIEAVKLYKDQTGVGLVEAKQAVESLAASHGLVPQPTGCLGMVLAVVAAVAILFISVAAQAQQARPQTTVTPSSQAFADTDASTLSMKIPVLVIKYFPVKGDRIDLAITGDWDAPLEETRLKTDNQTQSLIRALQEGSRYHGYKGAEARPSLAYEVVDEIEFLEPMPTGRKQRLNCDRWGGDSLKWFVYWMQNLPGADNGLSYDGRPLTNWWIFIGDFDYAMQRKMTLVEERRAPQP